MSDLPTYEYVCENCGRETEVERRISDTSDQPCDNCRNPQMRRLISHTNFILRGTGWGGDRQGTDVTDRNWLRKFEGATDDGETSDKMGQFLDNEGLPET